MFQSFKNQNVKYSLVKIKDIINKCAIPKCQRPSINDRINTLSEKMLFSFNPITPLYFVSFNETKYLIDGLHRMNIYKNNPSYLNHKIPIVEIQAHSESDIEKYFNLINDNIALHNIYLNNNIDNDKDIEMEDIESTENDTIIRTNIIKETHKYFVENFPNSFKYNGRRRPFLNNNKFLDHLEIIYDKKKSNINNSKNFIDLLLNLNNKYKKQTINWFPSKGKVDNTMLINLIKEYNCLYFGMLPNDWILHLDQLPEYNSEDKISKSLRQIVWNKYCNNKNIIKCLCCDNNDIDSFTFECGHIVPSSKNGKCNIKNLVPICRTCNNSMSNTNMIDYMINNNFTKNLHLINI
jgi:hypothetical protein